MKAMRHIVTFIKNYLCAKDTKITDYSPMNETTPRLCFYLLCSKEHGTLCSLFCSLLTSKVRPNHLLILETFGRYR